MDEGVLRRIVHNFYVLKKEVPSVRKVTEELRQSLDIDCKDELVRRKLGKIDFRFLRCKSNRHVLIEKPDIMAARRAYLRAVKDARQKPDANLVYLDESYVHTTTVVQKCWQDDKEHGVLQSCSKCARFILVHAGGEDGFVPNAGLIFKSGSKSGDYHDDRNHQNFVKWLQEKPIPNLSRNSTIILDNAPHHNVQTSKAPSCASKKTDIKAWLQQQNIPYEETMLKDELLQLVKENKPPKNFVIDCLLRNHGHSVLRLPPYHPELNPIEMIWKQVKDSVRNVNMSSLSANVIIQKSENAFATIGKENWSNVCKHVQNIEKKYWKEDGLVEQRVEQFIITLGPHSDTEESDEDSDDDLSGVELIN